MGKCYRRYVHDHSDKIPAWESVTEGMYIITVTAMQNTSMGKSYRRYVHDHSDRIPAWESVTEGMYMITETEYQHGKELQKVCT